MPRRSKVIAQTDTHTHTHTHRQYENITFPHTRGVISIAYINITVIGILVAGKLNYLNKQICWDMHFAFVLKSNSGGTGNPFKVMFWIHHLHSKFPIL